MTYWRQITQAALATTVTAALLAGVPYVLVRGVDWPPWRSTLEALRYGQATPDLLIAVLAVVVWIAWAQLTLALAVEIVAAARGVAADRVALLALMQPLAARLISTVLLLSSTFGARPALAAAPPPLAAHTAVTDPADAGPVSDQDAVDLTELRRYDVKRGDTLWGIAEHHLGDGRRWREIRDLNAGRAQPGGRSLEAHGDAIDVGWTLLLPRLAAPGDHDSRETRDHVIVERGDTLSGLAEQHLGDPDAWPALFAHNEDRAQPDGNRLTSPDKLRPGWRIDIPRDHDGHGQAPTDAPVDTAAPDGDADAPDVRGSGLRDLPAEQRSDLHAAAPQPTQVTPTAATVPADNGANDHQVTDDEEGVDAGWWWITAGGMTAAGIAAAFERQRRIWQRRRGFGAPLPDVDSDDAAMVADAVRPAGTDAARARASLAVRAFAAAAPDARVAGVTIDVDGTIAVLLEQAAPADLPDGWYPDAFDNRAVELPPGIPNGKLEPDAALTTAAASTLVSVGVGTRTGQLLLIALESAHSVALAGPADLVEESMLAWTLELATSDHAAALDVWLVGFDLKHLEHAAEWERIHCIDSAADAITQIRSHALGTNGQSRLPGRGDDDWLPQVIMCAPHLADAPLRTVHAFAEMHRDAGVITVAAGDHSTAGWRLNVADNTVTVTSLQQPITLQPVRRITREEFRAITGTVTAAKHAAAETIEQPAEPAPVNAAELLERLTVPSGPPHDADVLPDDLVIVRLLGPVSIETPTGATVPPGHTTEAIAYLACHRDGPGVSTDRMIDILWNGRAVHRQRLVEVMSRARQAIGGTDRIPRRANGRGYHVTDTVVTDIELLGWWIRHAQGDPEGLREHLGAALGLITGRPFSDVDWTWATLEGLDTAAVATICDVATVLGQWCLDHDDPAGALHAAQQARKAAPESEQLARLRMRAHHRRGDLDRLRAIMNELRAAADADLGPDGDDQLHPDTVALYQSLISQRAPAARSS